MHPTYTHMRGRHQNVRIMIHSRVLPRLMVMSTSISPPRIIALSIRWNSLRRRQRHHSKNNVVKIDKSVEKYNHQKPTNPSKWKKKRKYGRSQRGTNENEICSFGIEPLERVWKPGKTFDKKFRKKVENECEFWRKQKLRSRKTNSPTKKHSLTDFQR